MNSSYNQDQQAPIPLHVTCNGTTYSGLARPIAPANHSGPASKFDILIEDANIKVQLFHDADDHWKIKGLNDQVLCRQIIEQVRNWYSQPA